MPRARTSTTTRSHHKKPAASPELEAMVDTIEDSVNPDEPKPPARPRQQRPGPKKVLSETTRIIGDGLSVGVLVATQQADPRKSLTATEAQSIAHPIVRMAARRMPNWLKVFLPRTKLNPDDAADIEEILATLGKWGMRLLTIVVQDYVTSREAAHAARQQKSAGDQKPDPEPSVSHPSASLSDLREAAKQEITPPPVAEPIPVQNGHNPAFDVLASIDYGALEV